MKPEHAKPEVERILKDANRIMDELWKSEEDEIVKNVNRTTPLSERDEKIVRANLKIKWTDAKKRMMDLLEKKFA